MEIERSSSADIAQRLDRLAKFYRHGPASAWMGRTLEKVLAYEADVCRKQLDECMTDLAAFEQTYSLSSEEFLPATSRAGQMTAWIM